METTSQKTSMLSPKLATTLSVIFCVFSIVLAVSFGSSGVSIGDAIAIIAAKFQGVVNEDLELAETILLSVRLPRTLVAALCGGALASAGVLSQGLFRNGLASPSILGTTTGASLAAAITFYTGAVYLHWLYLPVAAFSGAAIAMGLILVLASRNAMWRIETLLLAGFALNALLGAGTSLVVSLVLEEYQKASAVMHWLLGGFSAKSWLHLAMAGVPSIIGLIIAIGICAKLNVLALGEDIATSLSINMKKLRRLTIIAIALLVGSAVSVAGAIPFVGLLVPHMTRILVGPEHKRLLLLSMINGVSLMVLADLIARTIRAPAELEVGVLTSLLGAPFFIWLLFKRGKL